MWGARAKPAVHENTGKQKHPGHKNTNTQISQTDTNTDTKHHHTKTHQNNGTKSIQTYHHGRNKPTQKHHQTKTTQKTKHGAKIPSHKNMIKKRQHMHTFWDDDDITEIPSTALDIQIVWSRRGGKISPAGRAGSARRPGHQEDTIQRHTM